MATSPDEEVEIGTTSAQAHTQVNAVSRLKTFPRVFFTSKSFPPRPQFLVPIKLTFGCGCVFGRV